MSPLDELAGWAATYEDEIRTFLEQLDELVADNVPAAILLAEVMRHRAADVWDEGYAAAEANAGNGPGQEDQENPYVSEQERRVLGEDYYLQPEAERWRRLASWRDDLIAGGIDPSLLPPAPGVGESDGS